MSNIESTPVILDWRPLRKNRLLGFAKVRFPSGMIIADVPVLTGERGFWASPPSKPQIGSDGVVIKDSSTGKVRYTPLIDFASREHRNRWSQAVVDALQTSHPEAFAPL